MDEKEKDFTLSDGSQINSHGFKVLLTGGIYARFDTNPVLLYDHNTEHLIGRWENRRIENGKLRATPVFDLNDPFAAEKARKVKEGFLRGASIGIRILKLEEIDGEYVATEWELIEASITPIPSDAGAVRLYNEKREQLTFEQVKLGFSNNKNSIKKMDEKEIKLSSATVVSLGLGDKKNITERDIEIAVQEKDDEIKNLKSDLKKEQDAKIDAYLSAAVNDGKINDKQKEAYAQLAKTDFAQVQSIIEAIDSKPSGSLKDMQTRSNLTGERANWTYLDWATKDSDGLKDMRLNNPTEFERLKSTI